MLCPGPQGCLGQAQHDEQRQRRQRRGDQEHGLDAVDHVRAQAAAEPCRRPPRRGAGLRGEHGAEHRRAHGAAERAEEAGGRGRDAELAALDAVLDRRRPAPG